jgi:hypothetical protein
MAIEDGGRPTGRFVFKHWAFLALGLMTLFVLCNNERFIVVHSDPDREYFFPVRWWLLPHGLGGALALFLGPMQFSTRIRQAYPRFHRIIGRVYLAGVAVGAPLGMVLPFAHHLALPLRVESVVQSGFWLLATCVAFYYILNRKVARHREWMLRSYLLTSIFVVSRVLDRVPFLGSFIAPFNNSSDPAVLWILVLLALMIPTLLDQKRDFFVAR